MLPVIGSKSYTDDMSSSLSITSPSIISIARSRGGSGLIREPHSLVLTRVDSPVPPETRSETRRPPVRLGEVATSEMLRLDKREEEGEGEHWVSGQQQKAEAHLVNCPYSVNKEFKKGQCLKLLLRPHRPAAHLMERWTPLCALSSVCAHSRACEEARYSQTHPSSSHTELHSSAGNPAHAPVLPLLLLSLCAARRERVCEWLKWWFNYALMLFNIEDSIWCVLEEM